MTDEINESKNLLQNFNKPKMTTNQKKFFSEVIGTFIVVVTAAGSTMVSYIFVFKNETISCLVLIS